MTTDAFGRQYTEGTCRVCGYKVGLTRYQDDQYDADRGPYSPGYWVRGRPGGLVGEHNWPIPHHNPAKMRNELCPGSICPPMEAKAK